jgi:hypothetical protein
MLIEIMKKIFIISALFLLTLIFAPENTLALGGGVFYCQWWGPTNKCVVDETFQSCDPGFISVPESCASLSIDECDGTYFDCISAYEEECYECDTNIHKCYSVPPERYNGNCPYTDKGECDADCVALPGKAKYRCDEEKGCIKAQDGKFGSYGECYDSCDFYGRKSTKQKLYCDNKGEATSNPDITGKLYTAIGCIPVRNTNEFIGFILRWAIGIGGGIAFLLIVLAGFQIMTSAGNPERLKAGQELLTSAIAGLILLIFSVFILRIIGVNILGIFKP